MSTFVVNDLIMAKKLLSEGAYTCVLCKDSVVYTSTLHGIAPVLWHLENGTDLQGFCAADRLVGKAAAMLFVLAGVHSLYAQTISQSAIETLSRSAISFSYGNVVAKILNKNETGPCPMERAVASVEDAQTAFEKIKETVAALKAGANP